MNRLPTSWLAWSVCALTLLVLALSLLLALPAWSGPLSRGWALWRDQAITAAGIVGAPILGGLVASRRPHNPYGWLWLGYGSGLALQQLANSYRPAAEPGPQVVSRLLELGGPIALTFAPFLLLLFPTGQLPSRRWRPVAWAGAASGAVLVFLNLLFYKPDQAGGLIAATTIVVVVVIFSTVALSALSPLVRYRRASGVERQQLKWFALAAVVGTTYIVGTLLGFELLVGDALWNLFDAATNMGLYLAVGIAISRYRLYDIDVLINRTLVYGSLTVLLAVMYLGGVVILQYVLRALTGQGSTLAVVASTLAIAALFNPLRRRLQAFVDRRFYRSKYDARKTLEAFSYRLRDETDLKSLNEDLVGVVRQTMHPEYASLWLRPASAAEREGKGASP